MKKVILSLAVVFTMSSFTTANIEQEPLTIYTSCGTMHEVDCGGMSDDQIFDTAEAFDWLECEGGREMLEMLRQV